MKTLHHVSVFSTFNFFNVTYTCDVKLKIEHCCMQLELHKCHIFIDTAKLCCKQVHENVIKTYIFSGFEVYRILLNFSIYFLSKICSVKPQPSQMSFEEKRTSNVNVRFRNRVCSSCRS